VVQTDHASHAIGVPMSILAEYRRAAKFTEQALALNRRIGNIAGVAMALHSLGELQIIWGEYALAVALLEESVAVSGARCLNALQVSLANLRIAPRFAGDTLRACLAGQVGDTPEAGSPVRGGLAASRTASDYYSEYHSGPS
jgi:hypothetical protein